MADNDSTAKPMTGAYTTPTTDGDALRAAPPLKTTDTASDTISDPQGSSGKPADAKQAIKDGASKVQHQATEKARGLAADGKDRAAGALGQVSQLLNDAAGDVDNQFGEQYGKYARSAAGSVQSLADTVQGKDVEELLDDARAFVRQSPTIALGTAAALGFVLARLVQSGIDAKA